MDKKDAKCDMGGEGDGSLRWHSGGEHQCPDLTVGGDPRKSETDSLLKSAAKRRLLHRKNDDADC